MSGGGKVLSIWEVMAETEVTSQPTICLQEQETHPTFLDD